MDHHLHADHTEEHMRGSEILTDIVIGMSDGLTVPFALAAGLSGAVSQEHLNLIWIAGLAEIAAGSIAMGLGGYLAGKTEADHYNAELKREYDELDRVPDREGFPAAGSAQPAAHPGPGRGQAAGVRAARPRLAHRPAGGLTSPA